MKVLLLAPVFAMVAIGLVYGAESVWKKDCDTAHDLIEMEACEEPVVTLFTSYYVASIIQEVA